MRPFAIAEGAGDIARIDVAQPCALTDLIRAEQMLRSRRRVVHLVILVVRGDVPRNVDVDAREKLGDLRQLLIGIVEAGNDQRDDLYPDSALLESANGVEHRLECAAEVAVVRVAESFEI